MSCIKLSRIYIPNLILKAAVVPEICNKIVKNLLEFILYASKKISLQSFEEN